MKNKEQLKMEASSQQPSAVLLEHIQYQLRRSADDLDSKSAAVCINCV